MARPRRFRADVDDVGAVDHKLFRLGDGRVAAGELAAVGKGIGRDVENAHEGATFSNRAKKSVAAGGHGCRSLAHPALEHVFQMVESGSGIPRAGE